MTARRRGRGWAGAFIAGVVVVAALALLPVTVPDADDNGTPLPGMATPVPPAAASGDPFRPVGRLFGAQTAAQQFPANGRHVREIALLLGTYQHANDGTLTVALQAQRGGEWQDLAARSFDKMALRDNAYLIVSFAPPIDVTRGEPLRVTLRVKGGSSEAITWWKDANWSPDGYTLLLNDRRQEGTARFSVAYAPESGPLIRLIRPLWGRLTIFLSPGWSVALIVGIGALLAALVLAGRAPVVDR